MGIAAKTQKKKDETQLEAGLNAISSVARPWKLEQNTSGQASRQALRQASKASRLWKI